MLFGSRLNRLATSIRRGISKYSVGSDNPGLVFDFIDNFYQKDKNQTVNFDGAITHARAGNATMTDGYGPELVTNGTFDSDSDWTLGTGWSIAGGKAVKIAGTGDGASQSIDLKEGVAYLVSYDVTRNAGGVQAQFIGGSTVALASKTASGSYTDVLVAVSGNTSLRMFASSTFGGTIDNVSVREMPVIKWAPHNLVIKSENFSSGYTHPNVSLTSGVTDPTGGTSAFTVTSNSSSGYIRPSNTLTVKAGVSYTLKAFHKNLSGTASIGAYDASNTAFIGTQSITNTSSDWALTEFTFTTPAGCTAIYVYAANSMSNGASVDAFGLHVYRSDLGGMVDNPDRGDSYVPTTSSAKYLPRIGHHVYNGSAWVNEGLLAESEARVNLALYSTILNAQYNTTGATISDNSAVAPTGVEEAATITENTANGNHRFDEKVLSSAVGTRYTFSIYAKKKERSVIGFGGIGLYNAGENVEFDLDNGIAYNGGTGGALVNIQDVGNGWFRCMMTYTVTGTAPFRVHLHNTLVNGAPPSGTGLSYQGDGSSGVYVWGLQIEEGDTASSFIPNSGTSEGVDRAAETFTIPSANLPWPPEVLSGVEEVTSGTFDTAAALDDFSTTGTVTYDTATQSARLQSSSELIQFLDGTDNVSGSYKISWNQTLVSGTRTRLLARNHPNTLYISTAYFVGSGEKSIVVTTTDGVMFRISSDNSEALIDNISVQKVEDKAVSIAAEGRMTYADEDIGESNLGGQGNVVWYLWKEDASNYAEAILKTASTRTGQAFFHQERVNVEDSSAGPNNSYSPDILVPYNIAGRHGSTFINGAVDGVALTADTSPTALPDLSSTDLELAYDYMGTISEFRVWDKDLGDAGIVEATNPSLEPSLSLTFEGTGTNSFVVNNWAE